MRRGLQYDFVKEMEEYCKSDVALLQAGYEAFTKEFERHADFNPFAKCVTIASACNLYWRKHCLQENTIAVEPLKGWLGANVNQSVKALQWLYFKEQGLAKPDASPDRIRHVRNGGEQSVTCVEAATSWTDMIPNPIRCTSFMAVFGTGVLAAIPEIARL